MTISQQPAARAIIEQHSKSFALASRLLPRKVNQYDAVVLYAYCRRADDAIDLSPPDQQLAQLQQLRAELDAVYAGKPQPDPLLAAFQSVVQACAVPRTYLEELLAGMEMDAQRVHYYSMADLLQYAYRVAGDGRLDDVSRDGCARLGRVASRRASRHGHAAHQHRARRAGRLVARSPVLAGGVVAAMRRLAAVPRGLPTHAALSGGAPGARHRLVAQARRGVLPLRRCRRALSVAALCAGDSRGAPGVFRDLHARARPSLRSVRGARLRQSRAQARLGRIRCVAERAALAREAIWRPRPRISPQCLSDPEQPVRRCEVRAELARSTRSSGIYRVGNW